MKCPKCDSDNTQDSQFCKQCASPLTEAEESQRPFTKTFETPIEELTTGSTFAGRYKIIEELGRGEPEFQGFLYSGGTHNPLTLPSSVTRTADFLLALLPAPLAKQ